MQCIMRIDCLKMHIPYRSNMLQKQRCRFTFLLTSIKSLKSWFLTSLQYEFTALQFTCSASPSNKPTFYMSKFFHQHKCLKPNFRCSFIGIIYRSANLTMHLTYTASCQQVLSNILLITQMCCYNLCIHNTIWEMCLILSDGRDTVASPQNKHLE